MTLFNSTSDQPIGVSVSEVPSATGPRGYLREAIRIARLDDGAMLRVAKDPNALKYAAGVFAVGAFATSMSELLSNRVPAEDVPMWFIVLVEAPILVVVQLCISAFSLAVFHYLAKLVFGATGTYLGIVRVLWLGSVVSWLGVIPVIGAIVGIWFFLLFLVTFETVDGIERLQALALMVGFVGLSIVLRVLLV
jgi:hypothetical protein